MLWIMIPISKIILILLKESIMSIYIIFPPLQTIPMPPTPSALPPMYCLRLSSSETIKTAKLCMKVICKKIDKSEIVSCLYPVMIFIGSMQLSYIFLIFLFVFRSILNSSHSLPKHCSSLLTLNKKEMYGHHNADQQSQTFEYKTILSKRSNPIEIDIFINLRLGHSFFYSHEWQSLQ